MWREGVPVCILHILQLYTSPNMSIPGENLPGPHIHVSVSMPRVCVYEGKVKLSVAASLTDVWVNVSGRIILGVFVP